MDMNKDLEIRNLTLTCNSEDRTIEGVAIVSGELSQDLGGFKEIIEPSALEGLVERCDIKFYYNHLPESGVLARSRMGKGSLSLEVRDGKLHFKFDAPHTQIGDYVLEGIRRQDFDQCSFGFKCGKDHWEKKDNEYIRHVDSFEYVRELSIVPDPAYTQTSVSCRSLDKFKEEEAMKEDLTNYYADLRSKL